MKKIRFIIPALLLAACITSCIHSENQSMLVGEWRGTEWLVSGRPSDYDAKQVRFNFLKEGGYTSDFGGDKEKGTYILRDDKLYTTAEDQLEIMVKIARLTNDSLVIDMNRAGQSERLTLLRNK
jgi:hypothetical protein